MKKLTTKSWLIELGKHLAPKAGIALPVYLITKMVVASGPATGVPMLILEQLSAFASAAMNGWKGRAFVLTLVPLALAWFLHDLFAQRKPTSRWLFEYSETVGLLAKIGDFAAGALLVPLVLTVTLVFEVHMPDAAECPRKAVIAAFTYVVFLVALHRLGYFSKRPHGVVAYVIDAPSGQRGPVERGVIAALTEATKSCLWMGEPQGVAESDDGRINVLLPVRYPIDKWSTDEATVLMTRLRATELKLAASGYAIVDRTIPRSLEAKARLRSI